MYKLELTNSLSKQLKTMIKTLRLQYFPISYFSMALGLSGFTLAVQHAELLFGNPTWISSLVQYFSLVVFFVLLIGYIAKWIRFPEAVNQEFKHPIKLAFFPTISISFLLFSASFLNSNILISKYLWFTGAVMHLWFTFKVINTWMNDTKFDIKHMNPAWFIPAVGNMIVPLAGVSHMAKEVSWFFFSIGFVFWIILLVIFFNRIIFHHPLPQKLLPTLFILIAPPIVGFIAYSKLTGAPSDFGNMLYYIGLFFVFLLFSQIKMFTKIKFFLSWWAYSFPMAAATVASTLMYKMTHLMGFKIISLTFFVLLVVLVILLLIKTSAAIFRKEICVEDED